MLNIPSCSTIVILKASDVILITNFYSAIKYTEFNVVGIKSLLGFVTWKLRIKPVI
jgi:hypothetical protein